MIKQYSVAGALLLTSGLVLFAGQSGYAGNLGGQAATVANSPLEGYLGFGYNVDAEDALYQKEEFQRQLIIENCMAEHGFNYWPRPPDLDLLSGTSEERSDPNQGYRNSLTAGQAEAYSIALAGRSESEGMTDQELADLDVDGDHILSFEERSRMGCLGRAESAVPGVYFVVGVLRDELRLMDEKLNESPLTREAHTVYVDCMNAYGVRGASLDEVRSNLVEMALGEGPAVSDAVGSLSCEDSLDSAMIGARIEGEREFFERNQETIERYAVKMP